MNLKKLQSRINYLKLENKTRDAVEFLLKKFDLETQNLSGIVFREAAKPEFILMTTEGNFGEPQLLRIPENTFDFELPLMMCLLKHEMVHVRQKTVPPFVSDKNEREWQAYFDMNFHNIFPEAIEISTFHKIFFAKKGLEYYEKMGENSELQSKYAAQKLQVEQLIKDLSTSA